MNKNFPLAMIGLTMLLGRDRPPSMDGPVIGPKLVTSHPWDNIQLSKSERRGKTPEQIQAMRKEKYEAMKV